MTQRTGALLALALASLAVLGAQTASYGLVYPAGHGMRWPLAVALSFGALGAAGAAWLAYRSLRLAAQESERFVALLAFYVSCFFVFVVLVAFGVPHLWLGPKD